MSSLLVKGWRYYDQEETEAYRKRHQQYETFTRISKDSSSYISANSTSIYSRESDMTQYQELVLERAKQIAAEDWAKGIKDMHSHRINSMWYEPHPNIVKHRNVLDITYNDGRITRDEVEIVPSQYKGKELVHQWEKTNSLEDLI